MANLTDAPKGARKNPRVDLTPMVDLGFLLVTFFIFTTNLSTPTAMHTYLPADSTDSSQVAASGAVTLIAGHNALLFFHGLDAHADTLSYAQPQALRSKLLALRQALVRQEGNDNKLFVTIKPTDHARLQHVVQLFDEMSICAIRSYALIDLAATEARQFEAL